jgi:hypothetical protein
MSVLEEAATLFGCHYRNGSMAIGRVSLLVVNHSYTSSKVLYVDYCMYPFSTCVCRHSMRATCLAFTCSRLFCRGATVADGLSFVLGGEKSGRVVGGLGLLVVVGSGWFLSWCSCFLVRSARRRLPRLEIHS